MTDGNSATPHSHRNETASSHHSTPSEYMQGKKHKEKKKYNTDLLL